VIFGSSIVIDELRKQIAKLEIELAAARDENKKLVNRLLLKAGVPLAHEPIAPGSEAATIERMLMSNDIFGEDETTEDEEIIDNRKEHNEFAP
jgi:hypothetical protein